MARLSIKTGSLQGQLFEITSPVVSIGRSPGNTIILNDKRMSRFHAELLQRGEVYLLRDLGSKNGTRINQQPVKGEQRLESGDEIEVGDSVLVFQASQKIKESQKKSDVTVVLDDSKWGDVRGQVPADLKIPTTIARLQAQFGESGKKPTTTNYQLETLSKIAEATRSILDIGELLETVMNSVMEVYRPDRGVVLLKNHESGELEPRTIRRSDGKLEPFGVSRTIIDQAIREKVSVLVGDMHEDRHYGVQHSVIQNRIRTAICSPLICKDDVEGVLYVDTQTRLLSYNEGDLELLNNIAGLAAVSISNARLHQRLVEQAKYQQELEIASQIQKTLICHEIPQPASYDIAATTLPAREVGGDFYDFVPVDESRLAVMLADVSGKGVPAAILASSLRSALQVKVRDSRQPIEQIIGDINRMTCRDTLETMFATLFMTILDLQNSAMTFCNAGHNAPLLFLPGGQERELQIGGTVVGIFEDYTWQSDQTGLPKGAVLAIFSDGVPDIRNPAGEQWGLEPLKEILRANLQEPARRIVERISESAFAFKGDADQFDDFTLLIIKSRGGGSPFGPSETETAEHLAVR